MMPILKSSILLVCTVTLLFDLSGCKDGQAEASQDSLRASFTSPSGYSIVKDECRTAEQDLVMINDAGEFIRITSKEKDSSSECPSTGHEWQIPEQKCKGGFL